MARFHLKRTPFCLSFVETTNRGMTNSRRQVCLFGTSANPPTGDGGHTGIVRFLSSNVEKFDEIRVIPVFRHTFASKRNQLALFDHRIKMCSIAFGGIPKVTVSDAEKKSFERIAKDLSEEKRQSLRVGTADLLEMFQQEEPNVDFSFCLGSDTFLDLTSFKWKRSRDVLKLLEGRLVVFARKGTNADLKEHIQQLEKTEGLNAILLEVPTLTSVSSSFVRSCTSEEDLSQCVPGEVLEYMRRNRLYAFSNDKI